MLEGGQLENFTQQKNDLTMLKIDDIKIGEGKAVAVWADDYCAHIWR